MSKERIYVFDAFHPDAIARLQSHPKFEIILPSNPIHQTHPWYHHAHGVLVRADTRLTAEEFARTKDTKLLRAVVKQGVGVDNIDLNAARTAGVAVYNHPGINSEAVAEMCLALTLSLTRMVTFLDRKTRRGDRDARNDFVGISLYRKTVGIIGMGNIGKLTAKKWVGACEANILAYHPVAPADIWDGDGIVHKRAQSLEELLRESDVVTLHLPLTESTRGMIGTKELDMMKGSAVLVNTSRGGIVEEKALLQALKEKKIWGAVLDAMEIEPAHPDTHAEWLELDNVIITPHVGATTEDMHSLSGSTAAQTLLNVLDGTGEFPGRRIV
ncbi:D-3-phosphoglycerate dehydrogenase [Cytospora mali]|uniref:D-3-phosphoglycerate dehydrogenase n=1 Tax=Cytospora mali TaxID=578113 RepID=A0A194VJR6_CYTMA|nr:D-3-phosphoglycerate dehydrogenase [Valsa mali]